MSNFVSDIKGFNVINDDIYFGAYRANCIFKLNIPMRKLEYLATTDRIKPIDGNLYADVGIDRTKLWFAPCWNTDDILVYDIVDKAQKYISVPMTEDDKKYDRFSAVYEYNEWFVFVPRFYPAILKVNKKNYEIKLILWKKPLLDCFSDFLQMNQMAYISPDFEVVDETMYLLAENVVIKYNMETDEVSFHKICDEERLYTGIVCHNEEFILVDRFYSELIRWNEKDGSVNKIEADFGFLGEKLQDPGYPFGLCKVNNQIIVMQQCADYLLLISSEWEVCKVPLEIGEYKRTDTKFQQYKLVDGKLYMPLFGKNAILIVNTSDWSQEIVEFDLSQLDLSEAYKRIEQEVPAINEGILYYKLEDFLQGVIERDFSREKSELQDDVGTKIYEVEESAGKVSK